MESTISFGICQFDVTALAFTQQLWNIFHVSWILELFWCTILRFSPTILRCPLYAAIIKGVLKFTSRQFVSAFFASSNSTQSNESWKAAERENWASLYNQNFFSLPAIWRGVRPLLSQKWMIESSKWERSSNRHCTRFSVLIFYIKRLAKDVFLTCFALLTQHNEQVKKNFLGLESGSVVQSISLRSPRGPGKKPNEVV